MRINKFGLLGLIALLGTAWYLWRKNTIIIESMGFHLETTVFNALVVLLCAALIIVMLYQGTISILRWPSEITARLFKRWRPDCISQLEELLVAVANHDARQAQNTLTALRKHKIPPRLELILANEVALLDTDLEQIKQSFIDMAGCPQTRPAGLEGLISVAMQAQDWEAANACCRQLWTLAPSEWLASTHVFILLHSEAWEQLVELLHFGPLRAHCNRETIRQLCLIAHHYTAVRDYKEGRTQEALIKLEEGLHKRGPTFMPLNLLLGELYLQTEKFSELQKLLYEVWELQPHPSLADLAMSLVSHYNNAKFFTIILKMVSTQPQHYESLLLVARAALLCGNDEEALQALNSAIGLQEGVRACTLMAEYYQCTGANIPQIMEWLRRASRAHADRPTLCYYWDEAAQQLVNHATPTGFLIACV